MLWLSPDPGLIWPEDRSQNEGRVAVPRPPTGFTDQAMRPVLGAWDEAQQQP